MAVSAAAAVAASSGSWRWAVGSCGRCSSCSGRWAGCGYGCCSGGGDTLLRGVCLPGRAGSCDHSSASLFPPPDISSDGLMRLRREPRVQTSVEGLSAGIPDERIPGPAS